MTLTLRPYQEETVTAALNPPENITRQLIVVATGGGKTVIMSAIIDRFLGPGKRALLLAHREELLTQAKAEVEAFVPEALVELEQATKKATRDHHHLFQTMRQVVIGSTATLRGDRLKSWARDSFDLILVDEAHHAAAKSYVDIFEHFGCMGESQPTPLIGVTATPKRSDGVGLGEVFQHIAAVYGIKELVELKALVGVRAVSVKTRTDISQVKTTNGDFAVGELEEAVNNPERNKQVVAAWYQHAQSPRGMRKTIAFCVGVDHAQDLADMFNAHMGHGTAEAVWGAMDDEDRKAALGRFKRNEVSILTNCMLLTEGFNQPDVSCIVLARPTKSSLMMTQMVGRGTRLADHKSDCLVIDMQDVTNGKSLASVPSLAGIPANLDPKGRDVFKVAKDLEGLDPRLARRVETIEQLDEYLAKLAAGLTAEEIDLMAVIHVDPWVAAHSRYLWTPRTDTHYVISPEKGTRYELIQDMLGHWEFKRYKKDFGTERLALFGGEIDQVFSRADSFIRSQHESLALVDAKAKWRANPASEKQVGLLRNLGFDPPESITAGQASQAIDALLNKQKRR